MDEGHATTTLSPPLKFGIIVTASFCTTAPHCRRSKNISMASVFENLFKIFLISLFEITKTLHNPARFVELKSSYFPLSLCNLIN